MKNKILLLIDCQYDFINGSLSVDGAEDAMNNLSQFILAYGKEYKSIILTADWHPQTHCSFKSNGGQWPTHCVQYSYGAAIYQPILNALNEIKADYSVLLKGLDESREEYSIFKNELSNAAIKAICDYEKVEEIDICGLAYDYCVADSAKDGLKAFPNVNFIVLHEFSPSIGDGAEFTNFIENSNRICLG